MIPFGYFLGSFRYFADTKRYTFGLLRIRKDTILAHFGYEAETILRRKRERTKEASLWNTVKK